MRAAFALVLLALPAVSLAQTAAPQPAATAQAAPTNLPVRRVVLYKTGIGYFEHLGTVQGNRDVAVRFTTAQLNDVLKSLTALDLGDGRITGISYNSVAPLSQRLGSIRLPLNEQTTLMALLNTLRGARIEASGSAGTVVGRLLGVEERRRPHGDAILESHQLSLIADGGELRTFDLTPALRVRVVEADLRQEIGHYLDLLGSSREQDVRRMTIRTSGNGSRNLLISYVSEVPVWKSTYRLVLPDRPDRPALLQGWAVVDNTIGEDWTHVDLSLVAGAPQTFVQHISQPYYTHRPVVPMPQSVLLTPQTHQGTLSTGPGTLRGFVRDQSGAPLPGVQVSLLADGRRRAAASSGPSGEYAVVVPSGTYRVEYGLAGFGTIVHEGVTLGGGLERRQDVTMRAGAVEETVAIAALEESRRSTGGGSGAGAGAGGGFGGGVYVPGPPAANPAALERARAGQTAAAAADLGDLFEYRIKEPVTIAKNQSALVPIVNAPIEAEKVSLWQPSNRAGRPLRAVWLKNTSGLTLDGGSFAVVESNAFAGEGLIQSLQPGERRLISYAADLAMLVSHRFDGGSARVVRVRARDGIIVQETEQRATATYTVRNEDAGPRVLVIEHPRRPGWELAGGGAPAESSPDAHRFRLTLDGKQEATLAVEERSTTESRIQISDAIRDQLVYWRQGGLASGELERALGPLIDKRTEIAAHERRLEQLRMELSAIEADQQRVRENMKALRGSAAEKQLLLRYTRQLDQQEDRLAVLQREIAAATQTIEAARRDFSALIGALHFDVTAEP